MNTTKSTRSRELTLTTDPTPEDRQEVPGARWALAPPRDLSTCLCSELPAVLRIELTGPHLTDDPPRLHRALQDGAGHPTCANRHAKCHCCGLRAGRFGQSPIYPMTSCETPTLTSFRDRET